MILWHQSKPSPASQVLMVAICLYRHQPKKQKPNPLLRGTDHQTGAPNEDSPHRSKDKSFSVKGSRLFHFSLRFPALKPHHDAAAGNTTVCWFAGSSLQVLADSDRCTWIVLWRKTRSSRVNVTRERNLIAAGSGAARFQKTRTKNVSAEPSICFLWKPELNKHLSHGKL